MPAFNFRRGVSVLLEERIENLMRRYYPDSLSVKEIRAFLNVSDSSNHLTSDLRRLLEKGKIKKIYRGNYVWSKEV